MASKLPGWVVDDRTSVLREAAPYKAMSAAERGHLLARACRAAARLLRARPDRQRALAHVDALPESSVEAISRLRRELAGSPPRGGRFTP